MTGTPGPDVIHVRHEFGQVLVAGQSFPVAQVRRVVIAVGLVMAVKLFLR